MSKQNYSIIVGTGSYIPKKIVSNQDFMGNVFYDPDGKVIDKPNDEIIKTFEKITGIKERRYVTDDLVASDIAYFAAKDALESSDIDWESLDYIIVAHNFGDVKADNKRSDGVPTLASRVKRRLKIANPKTIAYDIPFGCAGWTQGLIQADCFIKTGIAKRALIIGAETLSRVTDPHDRDSMIYADGAGATIIEAVNNQEPVGILSHGSRSDTLKHSSMLWMGRSNNNNYEGNELFIKMNGHKLYEYALKNVPKVVIQSIESTGLKIKRIDKVLIHQANEKMDEAILQRFFKCYGIDGTSADIMPMTISWLGNSSVATIPTMLDLLCKEKLNGHSWRKGNHIIFASVGAGMNITSIVYKVP